MVPNFTQLETRKTKPIPVKSIWTKAEVPTDNRKTPVKTCWYFLLTQRKI